VKDEWYGMGEFSESSFEGEIRGTFAIVGLK
jgi:hypothetical protein